jgi:PKD repeat protein
VAKPTFTAPASPAVLTFQLVVTSTVGLPSIADQVVVEVVDVPISGLTAGNDVETTLGQVTALSAEATGSNITYVWNLGDGTVINGKSVQHTYAATGAYTAIVTATNSTGSAQDSALVIVNNLTPAADAGADFEAIVDTPVTLDGSGSNDPDGHTPLAYGWSQSGGPSVVLDNPASAQPSFVAPATPSVVSFSLVVTDARGLVSAISEVNVTIKDAPVGTVSATNDGPTTVGLPTALNVTSGGTNATYTWDMGDGSPTKNGTAVTHVYGATGIYQAVVTVVNSEGVASATTTVVVVNESPIAQAGADQSVLVEASVELDGSGSSDPDGHTPLAYRWAQTGGTSVNLVNAAGAKATFTAPATPGTLTFGLTVTDTFGQASMVDTVVVEVSDGSISGVAIQSSSPTILGQNTILSASAAGSNVNYAWELGDGSVATGSTVNHTYEAAGTYTVKVTASNQMGSQEATTAVVVTNQPPVVNAGSNQSVNVNTQVVLDGSGSSDPDGHTPLLYLWVQTGGAPVTLSDASSATPTFVAPGTPGALTFSLTVTDAYGLAGTGQTVVNAGAVPISNLEITTNSPSTLGGSTTFVASAVGSGITYEWTMGDGTPTKTGTQIEHTYTRTGTYTVIVVATNELGAATKTTTIAVVNPAPVIFSAQFNPEPPADVDEYTLTLTGEGFVPGAIGYWNNQPRPTTVVSPTQIIMTLTVQALAENQAVVTAASTSEEAQNSGTATVHVANPAPGGGSSEPIIVEYATEPTGEPVTPPSRLFMPRLQN